MGHIATLLLLFTPNSKGKPIPIIKIITNKTIFFVSEAFFIVDELSMNINMPLVYVSYLPICKIETPDDKPIPIRM
jgi:hypothetical protein